MRQSGIASALVGVVLAAGTVFAASTEGKGGLLPMGSPAPAFRLPDVVSGRTVSLEDFAGRTGLLIMVACRHCPYVQHVREGMATLARDYEGQDVGIIAISANDPAGYSEDAPESLKEMAVESEFIFPLLFDETQETAKALTAVATPDFFLFGRERRLVYRGQFDGSRPGNDTPVTGQDVRAALDALLADQPIPEPQHAAFGCSIKWKPGNAPAY
ncbi:MAG: thioredoxin family protein [Candidatus Omnitrophica bacterium]|nr:thioredoxin family protein [Candidatus Omnitrophota bacterium]